MKQGYSDVNAVIIQMRNMGAKFSSIQRYLKSEYDIDLTQQAIRNRYVRNVNEKYSRTDIMQLILQGKTDDQICNKLNIQKSDLYKDISSHEKEYNSWCRTVLSEIASDIDLGIDKYIIDSQINIEAGCNVSKDRLNELYQISVRMFIEKYVRKKKKYFGNIEVKKVTVYDLIKKASE